MLRIVLLTLLSLRFFGVLAHGTDPLFIENKGQWHGNVIAKLEFPGTEVYLEQNGFTYVFYDESTLRARSLAHIGQNSGPLPERLKAHAVKFYFDGAQTQQTQGEQEQITRFNYFVGKDPKKWASGAKAYKAWYYRNLYPGIDMRCSLADGGLKYDLIVHPGADPSLIKAHYEGVDELSLKNNQIKAKCTVSSWIEAEPISFQLKGEQKKPVECHYVLNDKQLRFELDHYDTQQDLIIDPLLLISTYSGAVADNFGYTATYDSKGFLYSGSSVLSGAGYPTTAGAFDVSFNGGTSDFAITKYDTSGTFRIYSTYMGGSNGELPHSLVVDSKDQLIVFGTTSSADFPVLPSAPQTNFRGGPAINLGQGLGVNYTAGADMFISKLSFDGDALIGSTFYGGSGNDGINQDPSSQHGFLKYNYADEIRGEVLVDDLDNIFVVSTTWSTDMAMPTATVIQPNNRGKMDGILAKFNFNLSQLVWSTYLGGSNNDALYAIDFAKNGNIVVSGGTASNNLQVSSNALQAGYGGGRADGMYAIISPNADSLKYLSYWGSAAYDQIYLHEFGPDGDLFLFGQTEDNTRRFYINHPSGFGQQNSGQFISKLRSSGDSVFYSLTFGNGTPRPQISPTAFLVDNCGHIYTAGWGGSINTSGSNLVNNNAQGITGMPVKAESNPLFRTTTDNNDFHIMVLDDNATVMISGFYFGEDGGVDHVDGGTSRFDKRSQVYHSVCASCGGTQGFPTTPGAASTRNNGTVNGQPNGCNNAAFKMDFESDAVAADFQWDVASCANDTVFFDNLSDKGLVYTWDYGDGSPRQVHPQPFHVYNAPGVYFVTLVAENITSCNLIDSITKRVVIYPIGKNALPDSLICLKDTIQLGFKDYPGAIYDWSPGIGLSDSTMANPLFFPDSVRTYTLITNGFGCLDTTIITTTVDGVLARFSNSDVSCDSTDIVFTNSSISADKFSWNFGDGSFSNQANPSHRYLKPGVYTVTLYSTTFDPGPVCQALDSAIKQIIIYPTGKTSLADTLICRSDSLLLGYDPIIGATYQWIPGLAVADSTTSSTYLTNPDVGTLSLISRAGTCIDTLVYRFSSAGVMAQFSFNGPVCEDQAVNFINQGINSAAHSWQFGDGNTSTAQNPSHTYIGGPGTYTVQLVSTANNPSADCPSSDTATKQLIIYPNKSRSLPDTVVCLSDSVQIGPNPLPGAKYKWTPASGLSSDTVAQPYIVGTAAQLYTLVISAGACSDTTRVRITPQGVRADFSFPKSTCLGDALNFTNQSLNANGFRWDFGDGSPESTQSNPSHTYTLPGSYWVRLISSSSSPGGICQAADTILKQVTIYGNQSSTQSASLCRSDSLQLGTAPLDGQSYQWFPADGLSSDTLANPWLYPGNTVQYIRVAKSGSCIDSLTINLSLFGVRADFEVAPTRCLDDSMRFKNLSSGQESQSWTFGDGATSNLKNPVHLYANPGTYLVRLIALSTTNNGTCPASDTLEIPLTIYPNGKRQLPDTALCAGDTVQLGYAPLPGASYQWTPIQFLSNGQVSNPLFYPGASGLYTLVSSAGSCIDSMQVQLTTGGVLALFDADSAFCQNNTISFSNQSLRANAFEWNFGDGTQSSDVNPQHSYAQAGTYTVRLVASDSGPASRCPGSDTLLKTVVIIPNARTQLADTTICQGSTLQLSLDSFPNTQYRWNTSFGLSDSTLRNPLISVSQDTVYRIIGSNMGCFDTTDVRIKSFYIKLIPYSADTLICAQPSFELVAQGFGLVSEYTWADNLSFVPALNNGPTDSTASIAPTNFTTYYVRGKTPYCEIIDSLRIFVLSASTTVLPAVDICNADSINIGINKTIAPGESYTWNPPLYLSSSNIPFPKASPPDSITYTLTAVIDGCFEYFQQKITITALDLIIPEDTLICDPMQALILTADGAGTAFGFTWSDVNNFSNVLNPGGDSVIAVNPASTRYYYARASNQKCVYTDSVRVDVDYIMAALADTQLVCAQEPRFIKALAQGNGLSYSWSPASAIIGSTVGDQILVQPAQPTRYFVDIENAAGCKIQRSTVAAPTAFSLLNIGINTSDITVYDGYPVNLSATPSGPYNYQWSPANLCQPSSGPNTTYYNTADGYVYLSVSDGICANHDSIYLFYSELVCGPPNIFVPNAFTPNGDGENDRLFVRGNLISELYFAVFDRWGEKVFETRDQLIGWDGVYQGKALDPAVFVYYLEITCAGRKFYTEKGNVTLIR